MRRMISVLTIFMTVFAATCVVPAKAEVKVGAARTDVYVPWLEGRRVALLSNHTGMVGDEHTLDLMLRHGVDVRVLFSPEHGFRGTADAGEHVASSVDASTGLPVVSLYGRNSDANAASAMDSVDVVVVDIQDVGLRFYTYYITMLRLMNVASAAGKEFVVLDRPNPNGMTVDGPVLDMRHASGVGRLPIPVVHGMTLGELARMIVGEGWLRNPSAGLKLRVAECEGYTHATRYELPVAPSPNLRSMQAIYLYPSVCLFEGTVMSLGRGTDRPFEMYGHPSYSGSDYSFTPRSVPGATRPPLMGRRCFGRDLGSADVDSVLARGVDLSYVIDAYRNKGMAPHRAKFFTSFFTKLIGNEDVVNRIRRGESAESIHRSWQADVDAFRQRRAPYLLYPER